MHFCVGLPSRRFVTVDLKIVLLLMLPPVLSRQALQGFFFPFLFEICCASLIRVLDELIGCVLED